MTVFIEPFLFPGHALVRPPVHSPAGPAEKIPHPTPSMETQQRTYYPMGGCSAAQGVQIAALGTTPRSTAAPQKWGTTLCATTPARKCDTPQHTERTVLLLKGCKTEGRDPNSGEIVNHLPVCGHRGSIPLWRATSPDHIVGWGSDSNARGPMSS